MIANRRSVNGDVQRNGHGNECFVCKKACKYSCSRCGEVYCSEECQTVDWSKHKYYCFEMPELIMISPPPHNGQQIERNSNRQSDNRQVNGSTRHNGQQIERNSNRQSDNRQVNGSPRHNGQQIERNSNRQSDNRQVNGSPRNEYMENDRRSEREQSHPYKEIARSANPPPTAAQNNNAVFTFADPPKNNDDVVLTFVRNANSFYIRSCSSDGEYMQNAKDFDQCGQNGTKLMSLPQKNDLILVKHERKFCRAVVLNVYSESEVQVALADIGRKVHKPLDDMRQLSDDLKNRKRYNFIVTLDHLPKSMPNELFSKFFDLVRTKTVFELQFDGDDCRNATNVKLLEKRSGLPIEMVVRAEANDIATMNNGAVTSNVAAMNNGAATTPASATQNVEGPIQSPIVPESNECKRPTQVLMAPKKLTFEDLNIESLPDVAELIITDSSEIEMGFVSAILKDNSARLVNLLKKCGDYGMADDDIYIPEPEELCLVRYEDDWYRAKNCQSKYLLFDFGTLEQIDERDIRRFPAELNEPLFTFVCTIEGFTKDRIEDFRKLFEVVDYETVHSGSICVKSSEDLLEYNVTFAVVQDMLKK